jgi:hypothetical protein
MKHSSSSAATPAATNAASVMLPTPSSPTCRPSRNSPSPRRSLSRPPSEPTRPGSRFGDAPHLSRGRLGPVAHQAKTAGCPCTDARVALHSCRSLPVLRSGLLQS